MKRDAVALRIFMSREERRAIKVLALQEDVSMNTLCLNALNDLVAKQSKKKAQVNESGQTD